MIIEFYPNPNKSKNDAPLVITPTYTTKNTSFNQYQAERRGITVTEFLRRDALILDQKVSGKAPRLTKRGLQNLVVLHYSS